MSLKKSINRLFEEADEALDSKYEGFKKAKTRLA